MEACNAFPAWHVKPAAHAKAESEQHVRKDESEPIQTYGGPSIFMSRATSSTAAACVTQNTTMTRAPESRICSSWACDRAM